MHARMIFLTLVVALCIAPVVHAQPANTHVTSANAYAPVASASYTGIIVVGLPMVGFIQDPVSHGHWGWPVLTTPELQPGSLQKMSASDAEISTGNVVVPSGTTASDLRVVDHMGRLVLSHEYSVMSDGTVDLSRVASGVYTVIMFARESMSTRRILVVR
jgi:hypothetical protein